MEDLDNNWILLNNEVDCRNNDDNSPATLGLKNMRGVFILVGLVWIVYYYSTHICATCLCNLIVALSVWMCDILRNGSVL